MSEFVTLKDGRPAHRACVARFNATMMCGQEYHDCRSPDCALSSLFGACALEKGGMRMAFGAKSVGFYNYNSKEEWLGPDEGGYCHFLPGRPPARLWAQPRENECGAVAGSAAYR